MLVPCAMSINGRDYSLAVAPTTSLLTLLRDELGLTGAKEGCGAGQCGACTVLVNGRSVYSCLALAALHDGAQVTTIEGLHGTEGLHPLQAAFVACDALQCGFCTPGQVMAGASLLAEAPRPDDQTIAAGMAGNLCRCGCYPQIRAAIRQVRDGTR